MRSPLQITSSIWIMCVLEYECTRILRVVGNGVIFVFFSSNFRQIECSERVIYRFIFWSLLWE